MLAGVATWMIAMAILDIYWLTMPSIPAELGAMTSYEQLAAAVSAGQVSIGFAPHLLDLLCLVGLVGVTTALTARRLGTCSLIPAGDPRLPESLAFENV
ncbi:MAG: hypothetical protein ACYTGG_14640 [Planctomycetota bacterium]